MTPILVSVAVVLATVVVCMAKLKRDRAAFEEHFPPISDVEFLARCSPGISQEVALKVRRMVAAHFAVEYERIHPSTGFVQDLGAD